MSQVVLYYIPSSLILKFYMDSRETLCCACWKWPDSRRGIPSNHQDSCSSRGKSPPNKSEIFTVCLIAVYPAAVWFLGSFNHRHRPQRPDLLQRRSNTAGTCVFISISYFHLYPLLLTRLLPCNWYSIYIYLRREDYTISDNMISGVCQIKNESRLYKDKKK